MGLFSKSNQNKAVSKAADKKSEMKAALNVPKTAQDSIPLLGVYENGIIQLDETHFSKMYHIPDINFVTQDTDRQKDIFGKFMEFLSSFGPDVQLQQVIVNRTIKQNEMENSVLLKMKNDQLNEYREEMNEMLMSKMAEARNNIVHTKIFVVTVSAQDEPSAKNTFTRIDTEISKGLERVTGITASPLALVQELGVLYELYNMNSRVPFYRRTRSRSENAAESFTMKHIHRMGLSVKDVIGPSALTFERDYMLIGSTYARAVFLSDLPTFLRGDVLTELTNMPFNMAVSLHYRPVAQDKSVKMLKEKSVNVNANIVELQKKASKSGYSADVISPEIKQAAQEVEALLNDLTQDNQKLYYTTITAVIYADSKEQLDENTKLFEQTAERFVCQSKTLTVQQEAGLDTTLPLGINKLKIERILNTRAAAIFLPFDVKEMMMPGGMYYGVNGASKQLILYNRMSAINGNGCIFGVPGSGKSFASKREIVNVLLSTDDDVIVLDPENEYGALADLFHGAIIRLAPGSRVHINPMDMGLDYSASGDDPVTMKADFIASVFEAASGSRYPLSPIQRTIIDRCVKNVCKSYLDMLRAEGKNEDPNEVPTLGDLYKEILLQPEPEAHNLALSIERYVTGTQDLFAHRTNIEINNRFTVYNIKDIGDGMKAMGLQICLDNVWNRMISNFKKGKRTWLYCDEFHVLSQTEASAKYTQQIWKRARKWNGIPTGITQQVEDLLKSAEGRTIVNNSQFVMMLSMDPYGRSQMQQMYNLSDAEMEYISSSGAGHGLIYNGTDIIPFEDKFPTNTKLYKAMTTKPDEVTNKNR